MQTQPAKIINLTSYRIIYGDTDQMGVVYYANYLRWFERGRSEFLRQIGLPYATIEKAGFHFPVAEVACRFDFDSGPVPGWMESTGIPAAGTEWFRFRRTWCHGLRWTTTGSDAERT